MQEPLATGLSQGKTPAHTSPATKGTLRISKPFPKFVQTVLYELAVAPSLSPTLQVVIQEAVDVRWGLRMCKLKEFLGDSDLSQR